MNLIFDIGNGMTVEIERNPYAGGAPGNMTSGGAWLWRTLDAEGRNIEDREYNSADEVLTALVVARIEADCASRGNQSGLEAKGVAPLLEDC